MPNEVKKNRCVLFSGAWLDSNLISCYTFNAFFFSVASKREVDKNALSKSNNISISFTRLYDQIGQCWSSCFHISNRMFAHKLKWNWDRENFAFISVQFHASRHWVETIKHEEMHKKCTKFFRCVLFMLETYVYLFPSFFFGDGYFSTWFIFDFFLFLDANCLADGRFSVDLFETVFSVMYFVLGELR